MTNAFEYDPDEDVIKTGGIRGMNIAESIFRRAGGVDAYFSQVESNVPVKKKRKLSRRPKPVDYEHDSKALENIAGVALMPFSHLGTGERVWTDEYRKRLSQLMHAGFPVPKGFSKGGMSRIKAIYEEIENEIKGLIEGYPDIKGRIEERNRRLQRPY